MRWERICLPAFLGVLAQSVPAFPQSLSLTAPALSFQGIQGGANPPVQTTVLSGSGNWTSSTTYIGPDGWLTMTPQSGSVSPGNPVTLTFTVNLSNLPVEYELHSIITFNPGNQLLHVFLDVLPPGTPLIDSNGIVNAASFSTDAVISPGSIASAFGVNLSSDVAVATQVPLPLVLNNTQLFVNGAPVPLFFVSQKQINFQLPTGIGDTDAVVQVQSGSILSPFTEAHVAPAVPGIFFSAADPTMPQGAILNEDSSRNGPSNPAAAGSVIQIFATGLGATTPPISTGQLGASSPPFNNTVVTPTVLINGLASPVLFSAVAPGFAGLYQVNVQIPASTTSSPAATLQLQMKGQNSNVVTFAVK